MITHLLLDFDGTLRDAGAVAVFAAWNEAPGILFP
jgi:hypothetical protein